MSQRFIFQEISLSGLYLIEKKCISDTRGFFSRFFCAEEYAAMGLTKPIVQMNHTCTIQKGSIRGIDFQKPPHTETKIVTCIKGEVWDVAVDIRQNSATFLQWHAERLTVDNKKSLYISEGFAHGFQTLTDDCELLYLHTAAYQADAEGGLNPLDSRLSIDWPLVATELSQRDKNHPLIDKSFTGIVVT